MAFTCILDVNSTFATVGGCISGYLGFDLGMFILLFSFVLFVILGNIGIGAWFIAGSLLLIGMALIAGSGSMWMSLSLGIVVILAMIVWFFVFKKLFDK